MIVNNPVLMTLISDSLAKTIGVPPIRIHDVVHRRRSITADAANRPSLDQAILVLVVVQIVGMGVSDYRGGSRHRCARRNRCGSGRRPVSDLRSEFPPSCYTIAIKVDFQNGILDRCTEVPNVISPCSKVEIQVIVIQVDVPLAVYARVSGWRLELGGCLALYARGIPLYDSSSLAGGLGIPKAVSGPADLAAGKPAYGMTA